jgi:hypothetical protein
MKKSARSRADVIPLSDEDAVREAVRDSILGLWDVVNELTRLRPSRRERYRVSIFGSARVERGTFAYEETKRAAKALAEMGCDIVTGGGPGLMRASATLPLSAIVTSTRTVTEPTAFGG